MKTRVYILATLLLFIILGSCINNRQNKTERSNDAAYSISPDGTIEQKSDQFTGEYKGILPCADCDGIETILHINADKSYQLSTKYLGKSDENFVKSGRWKMHANTLTLEGIDYKFRILDDQLSQLDLSGNDIKGDLADQYRLAKFEE
ncbi:copper resistance protein NlpE [Sphingobacterium spiritivorum]|uniref:NlpE C-terminal OB domain-containing protein n=1 Tax=Sphingobacterium spiritivorum ATCC 33861 TaxID=525373 RepID=D7VTT6_SPHSI|nr:copper resistance protein NlpE [Sphingobacterium spiritivorum]EFK55715.1 hypothetical protein HMPREF0766_14406 [Sphingobacterium spiritivorum ATCC 33861]QQT34156.1 copper resistance protein NlpE N-terminal domain-containing protein [Sphingobacterium spiritivorum]WQD34991.1 copper resistance protein NlpE [Sphingobacterium spiritivorum]SUI98828.1 Copper homeostasis protein CutF [Sphingobacterium spiritivorum]